MLFAYLDPGTGSIIIQALIGVGAGIAIFGRHAIGGLLRRFRGGSSKKKDSKQRNTDDEDDE